MSDRPYEELVIPFATEKDLYTEGLVKILKSLCVPANRAIVGDVIGLYQSYKRTFNSMSRFPILGVAIQSKHGFVRSPFTELPEHVQEKIALRCMKAQCAPMVVSSVESVASFIDPGDGDGFYFDVLMTPEFAIFSTDDYDDRVLQGQFDGEDREQEHVNQCFQVILPRAVQSNHALLQESAVISQAQIVVNSLYPIPDENGENVPLSIPDLTPLTQGAVAQYPAR